MKIKFILVIILSIATVQLFSGCAGSGKVQIGSDRVFQVADSLASDRAMDFYLTGSIHEEAGEYYQAAIKYQLAHLYDPNSAAIVIALSNIYNLINEKDASIAVLEQGWNINPRDEELTKAIIRVYLRLGKFEKAIYVFNSISEWRDLTEIELGIKAAVLTNLNLLDEALETYDQILNRFEPSPKIYDKIARIYLSRTDLESAEKALSSLLALDPDNHKVMFVLGGFSVARKEWERAEEFFWDAIELDSLQIPYWRNLLLAIGQQHKLEEQLQVSNRAMNIFPDVPQFHDIIAGTLQELGRFEEAVAAADKSIQLDSTRMTPWLTKAYIYHQQERWELSGNAYKAALKINPESALVLNNYAYMFALQNTNLEEAMTMVNKAIELEPKNSSFLDTKAWLLFRMNKYDEALNQLTLALENSEENAEMMIHLASIHEAIGNEKLAIKARARARELEAIENK